jgi:hypothetical protein
MLEEQKHLLQHPATAELLLQNLVASATQLYQRHVTYQQQQQQRQQDKQQRRADLLAIPAYHEDMVQLLPSGPSCLDAAAAAAAAVGDRTGQPALQLELWLLADKSCSALVQMLLRGFVTPANQQQQAPRSTVLSAAAVRLVLELQLLAAAEQQRWEQQQQQVQEQDDDSAYLLATLQVNYTRLLHNLIRAATEASGSCLPAEVLQQAGLQLLQALAAPLQQVQLSSDGRLLEFMQALSLGAVQGDIGEACHALVAAACGPGPTDVDGELPRCHSATADRAVLCSLPSPPALPATAALSISNSQQRVYTRAWIGYRSQLEAKSKESGPKFWLPALLGQGLVAKLVAIL